MKAAILYLFVVAFIVMLFSIPRVQEQHNYVKTQQFQLDSVDISGIIGQM